MVCQDILDASVAGRDATASGQHRRADIVGLHETGHYLRVVCLATLAYLALLEGLFALGFVQLPKRAHQLREDLAHTG